MSLHMVFNDGGELLVGCIGNADNRRLLVAIMIKADRQ
jgi:hypothetical protein